MGTCVSKNPGIQSDNPGPDDQSVDSRDGHIDITSGLNLEPSGSTDGALREPLPEIAPTRRPAAQRGNLNLAGPSSQQIQQLLQSERDANAADSPLNAGDLLSPLSRPDALPTPPAASTLPSTRAARAAAQRSELEVLCDELLAVASFIEPTLTAALHKTAAATDGTLEGLQYRLKTRDSLLRKATADFLEERQNFFESLSGRYQKQPKTIDEVVFLISDVLRYTIVFPTERYTPGTKNALKRLRNGGFKALKCKNYWEPNDSYQGINCVLGHELDESRTAGRKAPRVFRVEVQFHTAESFEVKMTTHRLYELYRVETEPMRKAQIYQQLVSLADSPPMPPGVLQIKQLTSKPPPEMYKIWLLQMQETAAQNDKLILHALEIAIGPNSLKLPETGASRSKLRSSPGKPSSGLAGSDVSGGALLTASASGSLAAVSAWRLRQSVRRASMTSSVLAGGSRRQRMQQALSDVESMLSYTVIFPEPVYWANVTESVAKLEGQGSRQVDYENFWLAQPGVPWMYRGYHVLFQLNAVRYEVQFHTPESYDIKENGMDEKFHEYRLMNGRERTAMNVQLMKLWQEAFVPRGQMHRGRVEWKSPERARSSLLSSTATQPPAPVSKKGSTASGLNATSLSGPSPEKLRQKLAKKQGDSSASVVHSSETLIEEIQSGIS
eukprot:TRINITY_DN10145_c0_g1_i1.p1 TRINITY_DN10145_c0_g1~~TRINITY_DN10145_c0_g1_i1.p1  ORF type:complete len:669 (-),score=166.84 TRINITY_DN10145_c0_g1_i1:133-2139(-)